MPADLTYLSFDALGEGVGASQVGAYVERLATRGVSVHLHSYEKVPPQRDQLDQLAAAGVRWTAHEFKGHGPAAGARRVLQAARYLPRGGLVHARADLAAAAATLGRCRTWVWDVRSFWSDQRIALGDLRRGSSTDRMLRRIEAAAARRCTGVVTLSAAALETLVERHGEHLLDNAAVVPTCVDLARFPLAPMPDRSITRLVFSGTLNRYYDLPAMLAFTAMLNRRRRTTIEVLAPGETGWDEELRRAGVTARAAGAEALPQELEEAHAGLCICRFDAGPSLRAAVPTKIAELLATGRPLIVNRGLGDLDSLLIEHRCGVILDDASDGALANAADALDELLDDPRTPERCRTLAAAHFDLDRGIDRLLAVYERAR